MRKILVINRISGGLYNLCHRKSKVTWKDYSSGGRWNDKQWFPKCRGCRSFLLKRNEKSLNMKI